MQLFDVTKILQQELIKLVTYLTIIIFALQRDAYHSYLALIIGNLKFLLRAVGRSGRNWHKLEGVNFELLYNKNSLETEDLLLAL